jgi:hypothetical protein
VPSFKKLFNRFLFVLLGAAFGLTLSATAVSAAPSGSKSGGNPNAACDGTHHSDTGHGANRRGAYDETCDGSPSGNGNGKGAAKGKPCAGCVGNADDKNPPGQKPNGSDHNAGYECDRNHGVGRTNPAHTGCKSTTSPPPSTGGNVGSTTTTKPPTTTVPPPACPAGSTMVDGACVLGTSTVKPPVVTDPPVSSTFIPDPSGPARVLGVQFTRPSLMSMNAGSELVRSAGELPLTGNSSPDLVPLALALVALGTLLARFGRSQKREVMG